MRVWTSAHSMFAVKTIFKNGETVIATQRAFCACFILRQNNIIDFQSWRALFRQSIEWARKALCSNYTFTSLKKVSTANAQSAPVQLMIINDAIWKKKK